MFFSFPSRYNIGYKMELEHFLDAVQGLVEPSVDGRMVMASTKIAKACLESAKTGLPVKISWVKEEIPVSYNQL